MPSRPDILMIGSADRNVGKTQLACELIRRHAPTQLVVGVKITSVKDREVRCPRGGDGCGVCTEFTGNYCLTEERNGPPGKDTTRLLEAGAAHVFWLRVHHDALAEGVAALLERIPAGAAILCESNSARLVLEPGLFLVIREKGSDHIKKSCGKVIACADRVLNFDGKGWDFPAERVVFSAGRWLMRHEAAAIILAGGGSRRMGQDKSLLPVSGRPMIQRIADQLTPMFDEILVGANEPEKYPFLLARIVPDRERGLGPLMGILSCLAASAHHLNFVTGCDIPDMHAGFITQMLREAEGYDIVVPRSADNRPEPLFAVYRKSVMPHAEAVLARGGRRIAELFDCVKTRFVTLPQTGWYKNLNTMEDYRQMK